MANKSNMATDEEETICLFIDQIDADYWIKGAKVRHNCPAVSSNFRTTATETLHDRHDSSLSACIADLLYL